METVLVIDDDFSVRDTLAVMLESEGFRTVLADDGSTGFEQALAIKPELILVDLMMPGLSGMEVCKQLRETGNRTPVIVLSAMGSETDKVQLLELGADDYVVKPFGTRELLARIHAVLRRSTPETSATMGFGDTVVDITRRVVSRAGQDVRMTRAEYNLLIYFLKNPDRALSREMILNTVWGYEGFPNTRTVDAHVVRLRQKLEPDTAQPKYFLTVHGVGYRFLPS